MVLRDVVRLTHQSFSPLVGNPSYKHNATASKYIKHLKTVSQEAFFSCFNCHVSQKLELEHQALTLKMCDKHWLSYKIIRCFQRFVSLDLPESTRTQHTLRSGDSDRKERKISVMEVQSAPTQTSEDRLPLFLRGGLLSINTQLLRWNIQIKSFLKTSPSQLVEQCQ